MKPRVTIIDYGVGNIYSVCRAFEHCGADVYLTDSVEDILKAERLILPGVGAFADGMAGLKERNLIEPIKEFTSRGKPFLGICLGMQIMLDESEEFGLNEGLGLIPGKVAAIPSVDSEGVPHKIPHIGWNEIYAPVGISWEGSILGNTLEKSSFYFVHSYAAVPLMHEHRLADCSYNGQRVTAVIRHEHMYGCQFHPEKSGTEGLRIIQTFLSI